MFYGARVIAHLSAYILVFSCKRRYSIPDDYPLISEQFWCNIPYIYAFGMYFQYATPHRRQSNLL